MLLGQAEEDSGGGACEGMGVVFSLLALCEYLTVAFESPGSGRTSGLILGTSSDLGCICFFICTVGIIKPTPLGFRGNELRK